MEHQLVAEWLCHSEQNSQLAVITPALSDLFGRFVAAKGAVAKKISHAPSKSQERQSFFLQELLPPVPAGPPLALAGD